MVRTNVLPCSLIWVSAHVELQCARPGLVRTLPCYIKGARLTAYAVVRLTPTVLNELLFKKPRSAAFTVYMTHWLRTVPLSARTDGKPAACTALPVLKRAKQKNGDAARQQSTTSTKHNEAADQPWFDGRFY